jgi:hypothetical protein
MSGSSELMRPVLISNSTNSTPFRLARKGNTFLADTILKKRYAAYVNSLGPQVAEYVQKKINDPDALVGITFNGASSYFRECPRVRVNAFVTKAGKAPEDMDFQVGYDTGKLNQKVALHIKDFELNGREYARFVYKQPVIYGQIPALHQKGMRELLGQALNDDYNNFSDYSNNIFDMSRESLTDSIKIKMKRRFCDAVDATLRTCEHLVNLWDMCGVKPPEDLDYVVKIAYKIHDLENWECFLKPNQLLLNTIREPLRFWVKGALFFYTPFAPLPPGSSAPSTPYTPGLFVK